jgi:hypothetical protein
MSTHVQQPTGAHHLSRWAWIAVACIPLAFVLAMAVGEGLFAMQGYDSGDEDAPAGAIALAGGAGILVFAVPCVAAWLLGRRAVAAGETRGSTPALVGAIVGAVFLLMNLLGVVGRIAGF